MLSFRGEKVDKAVETIVFVNRFVDEFTKAELLKLGRINSRGLSRGKAPSRWIPPPTGWIKINCDAALDLHSGSAGLGIIIRDEVGRVIECAAIKKPAIQSIPTLEAMAIYEGLRMSKNLGAINILVESDAEVVINKLNSDLPDFSIFGHFVESISSLAGDFSNCSFKHLSRIGNRAAHGLARSCLNVSDCRQWLNCFPEFISDTIYHDVNFCNNHLTK